MECNVLWCDWLGVRGWVARGWHACVQGMFDSWDFCYHGINWISHWKQPWHWECALWPARALARCAVGFPLLSGAGRPRRCGQSSCKMLGSLVRGGWGWLGAVKKKTVKGLFSWHWISVFGLFSLCPSHCRWKWKWVQAFFLFFLTVFRF